MGLDGTETYDLTGLEHGLAPRMDVTLVIKRASGETQTVPVTLRIDTPIEVDYFLHGGILPFVLRQLIREGGDTVTPAPIEAINPEAPATVAGTTG